MRAPICPAGPDAVGLARGEGRGGTIQAQVTHPHPLQEPHAVADLLKEPVRHRSLALRELQGLEGGPGLAHRQPHVIGQALAHDAHRETLAAQTRPPALRADRVGRVAELLEREPAAARLRAVVAGHPQRSLQAAAQMGQDATVARAVAFQHCLEGLAARARPPASRARSRGGGPRRRAPPAGGASQCRRQGWIAPSRSESALSGTTFAASTSQRMPSPSHPGHAP